MSADPFAVPLGSDRVVRLFGESPAEAIDRLRAMPAPSNDVLRKRESPARGEDATVAGVLAHRASGTQANQLTAIADAAMHANAMLADLMNFVRSGMGGLTVRRRPLDLKVLCERVVDAVHCAHPDRPVVFTSDRRVDGRWDPEAIELLLSKLLVNAIQHSPRRPAVRVALQAVAESAVLDVWSPGIIAPEVMPDLFEPFVAGGSALQRRPHLGLGLYLAREVARAHGGRIEVRAAEGTLFRVVLPRL
jgi:sigma-B regulation protein RsbU (phosphoserine phosphatase)